MVYNRPVYCMFSSTRDQTVINFSFSRKTSSLGKTTSVIAEPVTYPLPPWPGAFFASLRNVQVPLVSEDFIASTSKRTSGCTDNRVALLVHVRILAPSLPLYHEERASRCHPLFIYYMFECIMSVAVPFFFSSSVRPIRASFSPTQ